MKKLLLCLSLFWQVPQAFAQEAKPIEPELQQLKAALTTATQDTDRMMAYIQVGYYFDDASQFDSALVYALKAEAIANHYPNEPKIAVVWNYIGFLHGRLFRTTKGESEKKRYLQNSIAYFKKASSDAKRLGNEEIITKATYNVAHHYAQTDSTYLFFKTSLQLLYHIETKNTYSKTDSSILQMLTGMMCEVMDYDKQSAQYNKYLTISKRLTPKQGKAYEIQSLLEFGQHVEIWKKADEQRLLNEYHFLKKELKIPQFNIQLDEQLAEYYFNIQDYKKSTRIINSFVIRHQSNSGVDNADSLNILSDRYSLLGMNAFMTNRNSEAIINLEHSLHIMEKIEKIKGLEYEKYQVLLYLSKAYHKAGNYKKSYDYLTKANAQQEDFQSQQTQALMAENEVQIEQLKQEKKVHAAQTQTLLKEQEVRAVNRQRNILIVLFAAVLALAIWAVYNYRKSQKLGQQLAVQNKVIGQQAESLSESNQLKDKIFALLSHDLRTPINRLVVALGDSLQTQRMALTQELHNVQGVLNNVLYWSSMQVKGIKPHYAEVHLKMTIDLLLKEFEHQLEEKQLTALNAVEVGAKIWTDETYLKIILRNIISNAIKFTNSQGFIRIDYKVDNNKVILTIKDTGIGIAADKLANLFQYPVSTLGTQLEIGTGLGLSLCYEMVKQLKGHLSVRSQEGQGTNVVIELPV